MRTTLLLLAFLGSGIGAHAQSSLATKIADPPAASKDISPAGITDSSYIIGPSDMLVVTVWKDSTLSGDVLVRPDGKISMPLLGDVQASGLKPMQLANQITEDLRKFMKDPEVSVVVSRIHDNYIYLLGEVGKKGPVVMSSNMTLLEAIASAGGLTDFANKKKIYILRNVGQKQQRIPVNYKRALKGDAASNLALMPGDTIVVP